MKTNYKQTATRMIKLAAKSAASVTTQWGEVEPLISWVGEFPGLMVDSPETLERALDHALMKLTRAGLRSPRGTVFGGLKLQKSPDDTWLLCLYSQFDPSLAAKVNNPRSDVNDTGI